MEALTNNKTDLWGVFGQTTMQYDMAENYAEKERLNDTRYRHDNAYFRLKMVMDYWCALWFWDYDHAEEPLHVRNTGATSTPCSMSAMRPSTSARGRH